MSSSKSLTKATSKFHQSRSLSRTAKPILSSDCCGISRCGYPEGSNAKCVMQERCRISRGLPRLTTPSDRERWQEKNNPVIIALAEQLSLEPEWVSDTLYGMTLEKFQQLMLPKKSYWKGCKVPLVTCDSCDYYTMIFDSEMNLIFPMLPNALMTLFELLRELDGKRKQPQDNGTSFLFGTIKKKKVFSSIGPDSVARENGIRRRFRNSFEDLSGVRSLNNLMGHDDGKTRVKNLYGSSDLQRKIASSSSRDLSHRAHSHHGLYSSPSREKHRKEHRDDHTHHKHHRIDLSGISSRNLSHRKSHGVDPSGASSRTHTHRKSHGVDPSGASSRTHTHHRSHGMDSSGASSRGLSHRKSHGVDPSGASSRTHTHRKSHGLDPFGASSRTHRKSHGVDPSGGSSRDHMLRKSRLEDVSNATSRYHYIYHHKDRDHSTHHRHHQPDNAHSKQPHGLHGHRAHSVIGFHRAGSHRHREEEVRNEEFDEFMERMQEKMDAKSADESQAMAIKELQSIPMQMAQSEDNSQSHLEKHKRHKRANEPVYYYGEQIPILAHKPFDPERRETWIRRHPHAMRLADRGSTFIQDQPVRRYKRPSIRLKLEQARERYSIRSEYTPTRTSLRTINSPTGSNSSLRVRLSPVKIQKYETPKRAKKS